MPRPRQLRRRSPASRVGRTGSALAAVLAGAAALAACSAGGTTGVVTQATGTTSAGSASGGAAAVPATLNLAYQADISSFDPDNNFEVAGLGAILSVYQGLVQYQPGSTTVVGNLATSWDISPDKLTYTFHLRQGVTFDDGTPMTSASVKASFTRRLLPANELSYFLADVKDMKTPDASTFVLDLKAPEVGLLDNFSSPWGPKVVGPAALVTHKAKDNSAAWLNDHADGTGPYELTTFTRGQKYVLTRNPKYWGPKPAYASIDIAIVPDIGQQVLQAKSGQLDAVLHGYPFEQLASLPSSLHAITYNDLGLEMGFVNPYNHLKTAAQRRRVFAALDPAGYLQDAFSGYATKATSLYPSEMKMPGAPYTWPTVAATRSAPVSTVEIAYSAGEAGVQQHVADLMIAALGAVGIKATAVADSGNSDYLKDPAHAPDILLAQNNPDSADPGSQADLFYSANGGLNIFGYKNAAADALITKADASDDPATRRSLYAESSRMMFADGGFLPIADVKDVIVVKTGITGLTQPAVPWNLELGSVSGS